MKAFNKIKLMSREARKPVMCDLNRSVQSQKQARCLKFWLSVGEELYYPNSENKGADQLRSYCEADLRLCFRIGKYPVFPLFGFIIHVMVMYRTKNPSSESWAHTRNKLLTQMSLASFLWDIGKQHSPRCDAAKCGFTSGAILFA